MRSLPLVMALAAATLASAPAVAHPKLLSASPAANAVVAAPQRLRLSFSERLVAQFSGADLAMTDMPGMKSPMKMALKTSVAPDGKMLVLALAKPLPRGNYRLDWHVVSTDTNRVKGSYAFLAGRCHGDDRPDCPIIDDLVGGVSTS